MLPERKEILVRGAGMCVVALQRVGPAELEMRECADGFVQHNPAMVENLLKLGSGFGTLMCRQIGFPTHIDGIEPDVVRISQFVWSSNLKRFDGRRCIVAAERELTVKRR